MEAKLESPNGVAKEAKPKPSAAEVKLLAELDVLRTENTDLGRRYRAAQALVNEISNELLNLRFARKLEQLTTPTQ